MTAAKSAESLPFTLIKGEMAERVRAFDWAATSLGPIAQWPQSLKTAAGMVLLSPVPIVMLWGEDGIMIYNDGYSEFAGRRHPSLLGSKVREGWPEVADFNDNIMKVGLAGGTLAYRGHELSLNRTGVFAPAWLDLDYSPILDENGKPAGVMAIVVDITQRVLAEKRVHAAHERLAQLFAQAPSFMAQLDGPAHVYALTNHAYQQLIGHRDVIGKSIREALPELEGQGFFELLDRVYRSGQPFVGRAVPVTLQRTPRGEMQNVLLDFVYQPIKGADESVTGIFVEGTDVTEANLAQRALGESEQRFHDIADATPVLIWISDTTKACTWFNKLWLDFTGRTMAQELGNGWAEGVHPQDFDRYLTTYTTAFDKREPFRMLYRLRRADGAWRTLDDNGAPRFAQDGTFLGYIGSCIDVTDQQSAEAALRKSEEQLRLATENAEIGMWDMDVANNINYASPRVRAIFGFPEGENPPVDEFFARIHPDDFARMQAAYLPAFDPKLRANYDIEYRIVPPGGGVRWVHAKGRGVFDAAGNCVRVTGTAADITKKHEIEEALRHSEEQLRLATEHADVGLWDVDVVNQRLYWPARVNIMFGLPPDHPTTLKEFRARIHPDDRGRVVGAMLDACDPAKKTAYDVEYRIVRAGDGVVRWVTVRGRAVFDDDDRCTRMLGVIIDISTRKRIEESLTELNETLEAKVAERTAALERSQQALQQAQKMEAIGNLTGGIAHDFNNLLQGVTGSLDLIRRKPEDTARVRRWAEAGLQASERGAKLTAQLLAFSRSQKLELKPIDVTELLLGMRDLLGRTLGPAVQITINPEGEGVSVVGDETQLELAVLNLAINARDAMPNGGELVIATHKHQVHHDPDLEPGDYIELTVTDSGNGMPPDILARAFDPFFTTKGLGKGTGLGLSQVYGMARQAGGIARLFSKPGEGTTVRIFLCATSASPQRDAARVENGRTNSQKVAVILVIDDDMDVRRFLADALDAPAYKVVQAENGAEGVAALERAAPDLMIVDYAMPGMTGAEVAQKARALYPALPIVFASGYAETSALENVADEKTLILRKPFRIVELQDAVRRSLAH